MSSLLVMGCMPEAGDETETELELPADMTHRVCSFGDDDELLPQAPINEAESWLMIESLSDAPTHIDLDALSEDDQLVAPFAIIAFVAPGLTDAFAGFNALYACTAAEYELNQCNWELETGSTVRVSTVVGANQNYTATVTANEGDGFERIVVVEGTIGDLGNLTLTFYEEDLVSFTRVSTRTAGGTETVVYSSDTDNWTATETANCSGSLEYNTTDSGETTTIDATWAYNSGAMSGTLEYTRTGSQSLDIEW
jgi:hypothetical protein